MNQKKQARQSLQIPKTVRVVFILSDGKKYFLSSVLYNELREIFIWLDERLDEFQCDVNNLALTAEPGHISVLEIGSDGSKNVLQDVRYTEYSLN